MIRFYNMAFRSTRILYMVGINENQFILMTSDLTRFANYTGLSLRIKYPFDMIHGVSRNRIKDTDHMFWLYHYRREFNLVLLCPISFCLHWMISLWHLFIIKHVAHTLHLIHIQGMLQGIQHQKKQLYCLPMIALKT